MFFLIIDAYVLRELLFFIISVEFIWYECDESCVRKLKVYLMFYIIRRIHSVTLFHETNIKS